MSQPNYKLRDDHVATVKHLRDERNRNDNVYATKNDVADISSDTIVNETEGRSYLVATTSGLLNGTLPLSMNNQRITELDDG